MRRTLFIAMLALTGLVQAQEWPKTKAESSSYANTSSYADVVSFLDQLQRLGAPIAVKWIGKSALGKDMPLVVCHRNPNITPEMAKRQGIPVVYIQANIHAGEVEGKESVLMLLRELAQNPKDKILDRMVIVSTPIYNSDGNDKWGTNKQNRGHQDGPEPVGERANGQGFDLNRDCMKVESLEMAAVLDNVYKRWDPDVVMDLHTTNGTRHGYELTYSPGLNPTIDPKIDAFTREMLAKIRRDMASKFSLFDYGDASFRNNAWTFSTFASEPRYVTNYAGMRNRIAVLSEAASFQPFKVRVDSTLLFVRNVLNHIVDNSSKVLRMSREADERIMKMGETPEKNHQVGIRFDFDNRGKEKVMIEVEKPESQIDHMKAPTDYRVLEMTIIDRFKVVKTSTFPAAYVIPKTAEQTVALLLKHGIQVESFEEAFKSKVEMFTVTTPKVAGSAFQGHKLVTLDGERKVVDMEFGAGGFLVRTTQPLGLLIFHLLEPESTDGVIAWGHFGTEWKAGDLAPIYKVMQKVNVRTRTL